MVQRWCYSYLRLWFLSTGVRVWSLCWKKSDSCDEKTASCMIRYYSFDLPHSSRLGPIRQPEHGFPMQIILYQEHLYQAKGIWPGLNFLDSTWQWSPMTQQVLYWWQMERYVCFDMQVEVNLKVGLNPVVDRPQYRPEHVEIDDILLWARLKILCSWCWALYRKTRLSFLNTWQARELLSSNKGCMLWVWKANIISTANRFCEFDFLMVCMDLEFHSLYCLKFRFGFQAVCCPMPSVGVVCYLGLPRICAWLVRLRTSCCSVLPHGQQQAHVSQNHVVDLSMF